MHILIVQIHVKPDSIQSFQAACLENAAASLKEPGIVRYQPDQNIHADGMIKLNLLEA